MPQVSNRVAVANRTAVSNRIANTRTLIQNRYDIQPNQVSNLYAWYRSDLGVTLNGSTVSAWADQSGNGRHLVQSTAAKQPTYNNSDSGFNGFPSLSFVAGSSQTMTLAGVVWSTFTILMVCKIPSIGYFYAHGAIDYLYTNGSPEVWVRRGVTTSSKGLNVKLNSSTIRTFRHEFNGTHASNTAWVNGSVQATSDSGTGEPGTGNSSSATLSLFSDNSADFATATIVELIIYTPYLQHGDTQAIEKYLQLRYGHY